ncbi:MAG: MBL fold metallo-hydrolase [Coriobacteriia bacterium]
MRVTRLTVGPLSTNCFIVRDDSAGPAVVVDPGGDVERLLSSLDGVPVALAVLTHGHFDHLGAAGGLVAATGCRLAMHADDARQAQDPVANGSLLFGYEEAAPAPDIILSEGDTVEAGDLRLEVVHMPGHTPGGIGLLGEDHLFCGDSVFAGSVGRTDLPGGDARVLRQTIERVAALPDETVLHPGHGPDTTVGEERRRNPFFPRGGEARVPL